MPSVSKKQHNLMAMVAHDPAASKRLGIPQSVGKDFVKADTGRKFAKGGDTMAESKKAMEQRHARTLGKIAKEEAAEAKTYKKGGFVSAADGVASKGKTKATQVVMAGGKGMKRGGKC